MNKEKFIDCEQKSLYKIIHFRLPHSFFKIGIAIAILAIVAMFYRAFAIEDDTELLKGILRKVLLIGMLIMSISRDKEEDELTIKLRMMSYAWAFITGVIYALVLPYVEFGVDSLVNSGTEQLKDLGDFQLLIYMLMVQLMCYHTLKRYR